MLWTIRDRVLRPVAAGPRHLLHPAWVHPRVARAGRDQRAVAHHPGSQGPFETHAESGRRRLGARQRRGRTVRCTSAPHLLVTASRDGEIAIEVMAQLDAYHVRGIALTPTQGLSRGTAVEDTGGPLMAPVGKGTLSRMFRRLRKRYRPPGGARRMSMADSPSFPAGCGTALHQVRDLRGPGSRSSMCSCRSNVAAKRACLAALGVGKTVLLTEMIHNMIGHHEGVQHFLRHRRTLPRKERNSTGR